MNRRAVAATATGLMTSLLLCALGGAAIATPIRGTEGADVLVGTDRRDVIRSRAGDDVVTGRSGGDQLIVGPGADTARGDRGPDDLRGRGGADDLRGGRGDDTLIGGSDDDHLVGANGADTLHPGQGQDTVLGGAGRDLVYASASDGAVDTIDCGAGRDTVVYPGPPDALDLLTGCEFVERTDGPIDGVSGHGYSFSHSAGEAFTDGFEVLDVEGDEPATVESVELLGSRGFDLLGAMFVGPGREIGAIQLLFHWPPVPQDFGGAEIIEAEGATLSTESENSWGWELLVGMSAAREGRVTRDGVAVSYTVGGVRYRAELRGEIIVCSSPRSQDNQGRCRSGVDRSIDQRADVRRRGSSA